MSSYCGSGRYTLRDQLLRRLPNLRFVVDETLVEGGPWSTRVATRYHTEQDGRLVYRGVYFGRVVWGKVVEEIIERRRESSRAVVRYDKLRSGMVATWNVLTPHRG
jgi:hypothetical protein